VRSDLVFADSAPELLSRVGIRLDGYRVGTHRILCPRPECRGKHNKNLAVTIKSDQDVTWVCHRCRWDNKGFIVRSANWTPGQKKTVPVKPAPSATDATDQRKIEVVREIYATAEPIAGTVGEHYFRSRGIVGPLPDCLRFAPALKRVQEIDGVKVTDHLPAIVAPFTNIRTNDLRAIHRTWLMPDGTGKADGLSRMWLGKATGCAIKLTDDTEVTLGLALAEGIETGLSVREAGFPCWALGSASNLAKFPVLAGIEALTIFADHDENGTGLNAARECAARWNAAGVDCKIVMPKQQGHDFNDALNTARARHG